jgi:hypothetical protein
MDNNQFKPDLISIINAPYKRAHVSTLGGKENASLMITVSVDTVESWPQGYIENSHYMRLQLDADGKLEHYSGHGIPHMRKCKVKNHKDAMERINNHIKKI